MTTSLHQRLIKHMKEVLRKEGTVQAVEICHIDAPDIVNEANRDGWTVRRTSLKVRNLEDAPDKWETKVLEEFARRDADEDSDDELEHWAVVEEKGRPVFRYMRSIHLSKTCTRCHGRHIDKQVARQLDSLYPFDQATGYEAGDLRGAYSLSHPLAATPSASSPK